MRSEPMPLADDPATLTGTGTPQAEDAPWTADEIERIRAFVAQSRDGRHPGQLTPDDGGIAKGPGQEVSHAACQRARDLARQGYSTGDIIQQGAGVPTINPSTLRKHLRGDCQHAVEDDCIGPLVHDRSQGWHTPEDAGGEPA